jgi:hypothetical protein
MRLSIAFCLALVTSTYATAREAIPFPNTLPPVFATAIAKAKGDTLTIAVSYPRQRWQVVGELVPKEKWPTLNLESERATQELILGGPSQLAESKVLEATGKELNYEEIVKRLAQQTPVLIAVDGKFPASYYLQLITPEALIIQLGPRDGSPAPSMLPAEKRD